MGASPSFGFARRGRAEREPRFDEMRAPWLFVWAQAKRGSGGQDVALGFPAPCTGMALGPNFGEQPLGLY